MIELVDLLRRLSNPPTALAVAGQVPPSNGADQHDQPARVHRRPRQHQVRLTADQVDELVAGRMAGATMHQLADRFGITRQTVGAWLKRRGIS